MRGLSVPLDEVRSIWYRRPTPVNINDEIELEYREVVRNEWTALLKGLWHVVPSECTFVSPPGNIQKAESKISQLELARLLGLDIPDTLVTNDAKELRKFYSSKGPDLIVKKLQTHGIFQENKMVLFVTKRFRCLADIDIDALRYCPCIFQVEVPKALDLRVVVIGQRVFAVSIDSQADDATAVDYRAGGLKAVQLAHKPHPLPYELAVKCVRMTESYGLRFGAFDFVITPKGDYVFLELNPNGQWLWLELLTKMNMVTAMCQLLETGKTEFSINGESCSKPT
jgi:glutathione synthase/RimK-type ligase-like ATP-grasp enzyme